MVNCGMQNPKSRSRLELPHNFAMPKMELQPSDKKFARIRWKQRGTYVAEQRMHLKQFNETRSQTQVASHYVLFAATRRKHEALVTLLQNGTSWLNMYQTTVKACDELSSSRGREELAEAARFTYQLDVYMEGCTLEDARDDPDLYGLNFNLRHCELLVPHAESQLATADVRRYAGFRNLGNTCFINATLQVF